MKLFRPFLLILFLFSFVQAKQPFYICTSADSDYFPNLINLINSVHRFNYDELGEIAVFDLGCTAITTVVSDMIDVALFFEDEKTVFLEVENK